jgi:hypothetical protein
MEEHNLKHQSDYKKVEAVDIALSLPIYLNIKLPSGSSVRSMVEILEKH